MVQMLFLRTLKERELGIREIHTGENIDALLTVPKLASGKVTRENRKLCSRRISEIHVPAMPVELLLERPQILLAVSPMALTLRVDDEPRTPAASRLHGDSGEPVRYAYRRLFHRRALSDTAGLCANDSD
jgi:hypothetical protein